VYLTGQSQTDTILEIDKLRKTHVSHVRGNKEQLTVIDDVLIVSFKEL